jgi:ABC-type dipeptide/oligopeptide/nickel transport system permease subunit
MAEAQIQRDAVAAAGVETRSRRQDFLRTFFSNRLAVFGTVVMGIFMLMAIFAPLIAPYSPLQQNLLEKFARPSWAHLLGQDELGRDILSRVIYGARISLTAGLAAVGIATAVGTLVGVVAGYFGRALDSVLMRLMDVLLAFPSILLAIGAGNAQIVFSGVMPNSMAPLIVQATLTLATAILDVAALSFLGLGARAPTPEWGAMLTDAFRSGYGVFVQGQHAIIFPGIAIALCVLSVNFIGDGLRDALDPRRRR